MRRLLLLSSSAVYGTGYLDHAMDEILAFLGPRKRLAFVPFALADQEAYTDRARSRFKTVGVQVEAVPASPEGGPVLSQAEAVFVGGGNTFRLLLSLQRLELLADLRECVLSGTPYIGASAGTNIACPSIKTTNDMPIVEPQGLAALGLVPFQINPHYQDSDANSRHMGETREERLEQYLEENAAPVVGLREGSWLHVEGKHLNLEGKAGARIFRRARPAEEFPRGSKLDFLLESA